MRYHIVTFGCQMNVHDSDWLARAMSARGWEQTGEEEAAVFIVNTCSVREKPEQKVYSELGRLNSRHGRKRGFFVAVGGCVAQQIGAGFFERFPFVRLVFGTDGIATAPEILERLAAREIKRAALLDFLPVYPERDAAAQALRAGAGQSAGPRQAFVNIMQGCDNFCAYCIVPYTRGRQKSRHPDAVVEECRQLVEGGARELTLLGQNVNSFGLDAGGAGVSFAELLGRVAALPGVDRLRFTTSHPKDIDPAVIAAFGELPNLCPQLHLPLQAGSDAVLKRMGRKYDRERYLSIVEALRATRPDIALTTDLIVGFPGETEEDFLQTLDMMERVGFESSFSFKYSDRPGTAAVRMKPKVDDEVAQDRLARLQKLQEALTRKSLEKLVGRETVIMYDGPSRKQEAESISWRGRDPGGRIVNVVGEMADEDMGGLLQSVVIREAKKHSLCGEKAGTPW